MFILFLVLVPNGQGKELEIKFCGDYYFKQYNFGLQFLSLRTKRKIYISNYSRYGFLITSKFKGEELLKVFTPDGTIHVVVLSEGPCL